MPTIKISLFQKKLFTKATKDDLAKIQAQKSQFLLLPEGYPGFYLSDSIESQIGQEKVYIDHLLEISEHFPGVIIGGSLYRKEGNAIRKGAPIVQGLQLVDFYDKKSPSLDEKGKGVQSGETESIFIMGGLRFGILLGEDWEETNLWERFHQERISIVFHLSSQVVNGTYESELESYASLAKKHNMHIIRVCGISKQALGRSLYASPTGVNWKTGKIEEDKEVLKTLSVTIQGDIFA